MKQLKLIEPRVESILAGYPLTRNNDRLLYIKYLQNFHNVIYIDDIILPNIPAMESISRIRRKIQAVGKYISSEDTYNMRTNAQADYIDYNYSN